MKYFLVYAFLLFRIKESRCWTCPQQNGKTIRREWAGTVRLSSPMDEWDPSVEDFDGSDDDEENRPSNEELETMLDDWDERVARMNTIHLVGRIGNSPEPRYFDDGKVVGNLSLACRRKYH